MGEEIGASLMKLGKLCDAFLEEDNKKIIPDLQRTLWELIKATISEDVKIKEKDKYYRVEYRKILKNLSDKKYEDTTWLNMFVKNDIEKCRMGEFNLILKIKTELGAFLKDAYGIKLSDALTTTRNFEIEMANKRRIVRESGNRLGLAIKDDVAVVPFVPFVGVGVPTSMNNDEEEPVVIPTE